MLVKQATRLVPPRAVYIERKRAFHATDLNRSKRNMSRA
jgi:hypothetical protein